MSDQQDLIIGVHSIAHALANKKRSNHQLWGTKESFEVLKAHPLLKDFSFEALPVNLLSPHQLQEKAKNLFNQRNFTYKRLPTSLVLVSETLPSPHFGQLLDQIKASDSYRAIALDQVTDIHNAAAIVRTSAFFAVDLLIVSIKGSFSLSPAFYRLSSGGAEYIQILSTGSLPRTLKKLSEAGLSLIGLSEHAQTALTSEGLSKSCLVLGAEDRGLSHAVQRIVDQELSLKPQGALPTLNVSVSAALAMEKVWKA